MNGSLFLIRSDRWHYLKQQHVLHETLDREIEDAREIRSLRNRRELQR